MARCAAEVCFHDALAEMRRNAHDVRALPARLQTLTKLASVLAPYDEDREDEPPEWITRPSAECTTLAMVAGLAACDAAKLHAADAAVQIAVCELLSQCVGLHAMAYVVSQQEVTRVQDVIMTALHTHRADALVQVAACDAVAAAAQAWGDSAADLYLRVGAVEDLVALLRTGTSTVQQAACSAVRCLVDASPQCTAAARKAGAAAAVLQLLQQCPTQRMRPEHNWVYYAAAHIASDRRMAATLCDGGALEHIVHALQRSICICESGSICNALVQLCRRPAAVQRAGRAGAAEAAARLLRLKGCTLYEQQLGYRLLQQLIVFPENVARVAAAGILRADMPFIENTPPGDDDNEDEDVASSFASMGAKARDAVLRGVRAHAEAAAEAAAAALLEEEAAAATGGAKKQSRKSKKKGGDAHAPAPAEAGAPLGSASAEEDAGGVDAAAEPSANAERRRRRAAAKAARRLGSAATSPQAPALALRSTAAAGIDAAAPDVAADVTAVAAGDADVESAAAQQDVPTADELYPWLHVSPRWTPPSPPPPLQEGTVSQPPLLQQWQSPPLPLSQPQLLRQQLQQLQPPPQPPLLLSAFDAAVRAAVDAEVAAAVAAAVTREVAAAVAPLRAELAPLRAALEAADKRLSCVRAWTRRAAPRCCPAATWRRAAAPRARRCWARRRAARCAASACTTRCCSSRE
jgi:hypothetical protein